MLCWKQIQPSSLNTNPSLNQKMLNCRQNNISNINTSKFSVSFFSCPGQTIQTTGGWMNYGIDYQNTITHTHRWIKRYLYVKAASNLDNDFQSEVYWNCMWNKIKLVFTECQHKRALVCELINAAHKMVLLLPFMKPRSAIKHIEFVTIDRLDQISDKEQINICFDAGVIWPHTHSNLTSLWFLLRTLTKKSTTPFYQMSVNRFSFEWPPNVSQSISKHVSLGIVVSCIV